MFLNCEAMLGSPRVDVSITSGLALFRQLNILKLNILKLNIFKLEARYR